MVHVPVEPPSLPPLWLTTQMMVDVLWANESNLRAMKVTHQYITLDGLYWNVQWQVSHKPVGRFTTISGVIKWSHVISAVTFNHHYRSRHDCAIIKQRISRLRALFNSCALLVTFHGYQAWFSGSTRALEVNFEAIMNFTANCIKV